MKGCEHTQNICGPLLGLNNGLKKLQKNRYVNDWINSTKKKTTYGNLNAMTVVEPEIVC